MYPECHYINNPNSCHACAHWRDDLDKLPGVRRTVHNHMGRCTHSNHPIVTHALEECFEFTPTNKEETI